MGLAAAGVVVDGVYPTNVEGLDAPFTELSTALGHMRRFKDELDAKNQQLLTSLRANERLFEEKTAADQARRKSEEESAAARAAQREEEARHREIQADLQAKLAEERRRAARLASDYAAKEAQYAGACRENDRLRDHNDALAADVAQLTAKVEELEGLLVDMRRQLADALERNAQLDHLLLLQRQELEEAGAAAVAAAERREADWTRARTRRDARIALLEQTLAREEEARREAEERQAAQAESYRQQLELLQAERDAFERDSLRWEREKLDLEAEMQRQRVAARDRLEEAFRHHEQEKRGLLEVLALREAMGRQQEVQFQSQVHQLEEAGTEEQRVLRQGLADRDILIHQLSDQNRVLAAEKHRLEGMLSLREVRA